MSQTRPRFFSPHQVCELDVIFNFEKTFYILDEFLLAGEAQETSKKSVLKAMEEADLLQEVQQLLWSTEIRLCFHFNPILVGFFQPFQNGGFQSRLFAGKKKTPTNQ